MKGGLQVINQAVNRANEIKHPVAREKDIEALENFSIAYCRNASSSGITANQPKSGSNKIVY